MENLLPISVIILRVRCPMIHKDLPIYSHSVPEGQEMLSCVNFPIGQRYTEAQKTLTKNFGQPHMVVGTHMR